MTAYYNENDPKAAQWLRELIKAGHIAPGDVDDRSITEVKADDLKRYTQCHFFAGIGGWSYALRLAAWPDDVPVWTASFPCQPFSAAGLQRGEKDERDLWPVGLNLIKECRPEVVFGEQVASAEVVGTQLEADFTVAVQSGNIARANKLAKRLVARPNFSWTPRWIDRVQAGLEAENYALRFEVLGAHSVGAPHIRQRVFWVADCNRERFTGREKSNVLEESRQSTSRRDDTRRCSTHGGVGHTIGPRLEGHAGNGDGSSQSGRIEANQVGPVAETGSWSDYRLVPCADGKTRRIVTRIKWMADGLSSRLEQVNGTEADSLSSQALPAMRNSTQPKAIQVRAGGSDGISQTEVLQPVLHGKSHGGDNQSAECEEQPETVSKDCGKMLCDLWGYIQAKCASPGFESTEQCVIKSSDVVRVLSHERALARMEGDEVSAHLLQALQQACEACRVVQYTLHTLQEAWESTAAANLAQQSVEACRGFGGWEIVSISPLVKNLPSRVGLLRGYGNAIVPQVGAVFVRSFMEV